MDSPTVGPLVDHAFRVAVARVRGPGAALAAIEPLERDPALREYHLRLAVRGQLLFELGRCTEAVECFRGARMPLLGTRTAPAAAEVE